MQGIMNGRVYCTYFDHNYLARGLALYHSLQRHAQGSRLWVLCLSETCYRTLTALDLPGLIPRRLEDFEIADADVAATRSTRSTIEYYFTCTPAWMLFVLNNDADAEWVTYLDSDLFFFAPPDPIYDELEGAAVAIIPHRYAPSVARLQKYGTYNVGWVGVHNDGDGRKVIEWWRQRCIEWCYDYVDEGRFADQGYLDSFQGLSDRVKIIANLGANLAPWNVGNYQIEFRDNRVMINATSPLIFFHFQGLRKDLGCFIFNSHREYRAPFCPNLRRHIYKPYVDELLAIEGKIGPSLQIVDVKPRRRSSRVDIGQYVINRIKNLGQRLYRILDIVTGRAFFVYRGVAH